MEIDASQGPDRIGVPTAEPLKVRERLTGRFAKL
jgi:hypothetical protein